jgi:hypothetical protein
VNLFFWSTGKMSNTIPVWEAVKCADPAGRFSEIFIRRTNRAGNFPTIPTGISHGHAGGHYQTVSVALAWV